MTLSDTDSGLTIIEAGDDLSVEVMHRGPFRLFWIRFSRNKPAILGGLIILIFTLMAIFAPFVAPHSPYDQDLNNVVHGPMAGHLLGTDELGRDILSRLIFGSRISMAASVVTVLIAMIIGIPLGLIAGYYRGILDEWIIMRVVDAMQAFPFLILALALAATLGPGFTNVMIAIGIGFIPAFIRIVRGQVLACTAQDYIQSAKALGASDYRIMRKHVLPNSMAPLLVQISVAMAAAILAEAGLSFLGVGVQPPTPSWGVMLSVAQTYINAAPWMAVWPGSCIFLAVLGFNLLGDGIREGLDPRMS